MQRIDVRDFAIRIQHGEALASDQDKLWMWHRVFVPVRCADAKRPKPAGHPLSNSFKIHIKSLLFQNNLAVGPHSSEELT